MADYVGYTQGSGVNIAADDISSVFYQRMKITLGADGVATSDLIGTADGAYVHGSIAHDAADAGNPLKIGGYAKAAAPTAVADADRVNAWFDRYGSLNTVLRDTAGAAVATGVQYLADGAVGVTAQGTVILARGSTAVPSAMSADGDGVPLWSSRKGSIIPAMAPHVGLVADPWTLNSKTAQYSSTQTSGVLQAGAAGELIVVTKVQIQVGGTTAGTMQLYFGTGAYSRGTSRAIFDGEFAPSTTLKPGVVMDGPFIAGATGDDVLVTTSAAINPLTVTIWYYIVT